MRAFQGDPKPEIAFCYLNLIDLAEEILKKQKSGLSIFFKLIVLIHILYYRCAGIFIVFELE